ncbi:uncharacterized protein LOC107022161 [Solanum pennellii]|uniref:Uncharacterized protein LOC107022161 n=1 Tax=Solanum pennellii TaxID=28526 RepID=A0ABM1GZV5_SOLPN|nr:uncharacterized protein LOC107022161 [Solanum pennellii]
MSPYKLVYGNSCHLPTEQEHRSVWEMKKLNLDRGATSTQRMNDLNMMDEFCLQSYESSTLYKEKMKRLCFIPGKLKSKWNGPFFLTKVLPHGAVELENSEGTWFMVNSQRIKIYMGNEESVQEVVKDYYLDDI